MSVSRQSARLVAGSPVIASAHFRAEADPYHSRRNPTGYVNLGTAENRLAWDLLAPRLNGPRRVSADDTRYAPLHGMKALREALAGFLSKCWHVEVDPESLVVVSGATAALDVIATVLCDPGQAIIVPAPYYGAFDADLAGRSGARLILAPLAASGGFRLDLAAVDRVLGEARHDGLSVRAVAFTSPGNPVGHVHQARILRALLEVTGRHGVDLIADEIYAHSVFGPEPYVSVLDPRVQAAEDGRTHVVWGFAKDFALPGLKAGVLLAGRPEVRDAARALAYFAPVSADTQRLLCDLLTDVSWADQFIAENRRRLRESYASASRQLTEQGIPHVNASAGFSLWADLSGWLPAASFAAEDALWRYLSGTARVNVLPGRAFGCPEPGWFRICHATDPALVREGITRIGRLLSTIGAAPRIAVPG
jgi:aspartate/methionine/tyrosine aminotransferase